MSNQQLADDIRAARALIGEMGSWCRLFDAINTAGKRCGYLDPDAVIFCAAGAINRAHHGQEERRMAVWKAVEAEVPKDRGIVSYNDGVVTGQAGVLAVFDAAIATAESC